jgi:hypothetical protein
VGVELTLGIGSVDVGGMVSVDVAGTLTGCHGRQLRPPHPPGARRCGTGTDSRRHPTSGQIVGVRW